MGEHYPECEQYTSGNGCPCICEHLSHHADAMVDAWRDDVRTWVQALTSWAVAVRQELANLRTEVKALPAPLVEQLSDHPDALIWRSDVLNIIGGDDG